MAFTNEMTVITLDQLPEISAARKADESRFVQMHCVRADEGIDVIYTWMTEGVLHDYKICAVAQDQTIPSITDNFLAAFVFENEAHDLFGVKITDIAIDFEGNFYALSMNTPMAIISPEQKAEREKAKKIAAAKKAKEEAAKKAKEEAAAAPAAEAAPAADADAELEAKLAGMDPEKAAKVRAAMAAKAAKAAKEEKGE